MSSGVNQALDDTSALFQERFDLLVNSGQANEKSVAATKLVIVLVEKYYGVQLTKELGAALANHLAVTLKKLLEGKTLTKAPEEIWQELQDYPEEYDLAGRIVDQLESNLKISLARDELGFIAVHLCKIKLELGQEHSK
jgi:transcriptional regulatory protein LevR